MIVCSCVRRVYECVFVELYQTHVDDGRDCTQQGHEALRRVFIRCVSVCMCVSVCACGVNASATKLRKPVHLCVLTCKKGGCEVPWVLRGGNITGRSDEEGADVPP